MFFNIANLDTKKMVAILGQDCSLVVRPFSILVLFSTFVIHFVIYQFVCGTMSMSFWWNLETFTCTLGVISSMICCDIITTSPSAVSTRVPVPSSPPLTVFTEYRYCMMFFHPSLLIHLCDLQHHQSLLEIMFHLQAKQLHVSFVQVHFHLNDVANVIIDHTEVQCLHPSPSPRL